VTAPNQTFKTSDGYINLAVVSDRHFADVCAVLELSELVGDPRFVDNESRVINRAELARLLETVLVGGSTDHWMQSFEVAGLAAGRLLDLPAVFADPQVIHNQMVLEMTHPTAGQIKVTGSPLRFDGEAAATAIAPPRLGSDTRRLLQSAGLTDLQIDELAAEAAVLVSA
jgi:crotonobetainyl-CoA:carnitine CoA-transferase CaiB-like acyl-CoA transferase